MVKTEHQAVIQGPGPFHLVALPLLGPQRYVYSFFRWGRIWRIIHGRVSWTSINWSLLFLPAFYWLKCSHMADQEIQFLYMLRRKRETQ